MIIAETKLDETFPNSQFEVENDHLWRADRSSYRPPFMKDDKYSDFGGGKKKII
jgi:hypothetical protein